MSEIYAKAHRALVWFGEDSDDLDGLISFAIVRPSGKSERLGCNAGDHAGE